MLVDLVVDNLNSRLYRLKIQITYFFYILPEIILLQKFNFEETVIQCTCFNFWLFWNIVIFILLFTTISRCPCEAMATIVYATNKISFAFIIVIAISCSFRTWILHRTTFSSFFNRTTRTWCLRIKIFAYNSTFQR